MKALCWHGTGAVRVDTVPDPTIQEATDVVIKITSTAICRSDLISWTAISRRCPQPLLDKIESGAIRHS